MLYFKVYKSQLPVIERALETAVLMLGSERSRGNCLEMICTDFLAGANLRDGSPDILLLSKSRLLQFAANCTAAETFARDYRDPVSGLRRKIASQTASTRGVQGSLQAGPRAGWWRCQASLRRVEEMITLCGDCHRKVCLAGSTVGW
jgi:hypothetical protein